jgi:hypothetical protein
MTAPRAFGKLQDADILQAIETAGKRINSIWLVILTTGILLAELTEPLLPDAAGHRVLQSEGIGLGKKRIVECLQFFQNSATIARLVTGIQVFFVQAAAANEMSAAGCREP